MPARGVVIHLVTTDLREYAGAKDRPERAGAAVRVSISGADCPRPPACFAAKFSGEAVDFRRRECEFFSSEADAKTSAGEKMFTNQKKCSQISS